MFDMTKIGRKISQTRKNKGLTQMELADKLGISYQAVSNWERGATMPDISKLPELAEIFGITIEELLCDERKGKIVEEIAKGETPENVNADDLADIAPLVNGEQFKKAYEKADSANGGFDISSIIAMAPFLDSDILFELIKDNIKNGISISDCAALAPFLDEDDISELLLNLSDDNISIHTLSAFAPFMEEGDLGKVARKHVSAGTPISSLAALAHFMNKEDLSYLASKCVVDNNNFEQLSSIAPFLDEKDLTDLVRNYLKNGGNFNNLSAIAPFLDMNELFRDFYKNK